MDIDKILKVIQRKVLKGTHLPIEIKEIQAGYLCSPYFKDLYIYVTNTRMYLPQVHWEINQTLIWSQLTVCWV